MFFPWHRDVYDHGRYLHSPLPVLRRSPRPAASLGRKRAAKFGANHQSHEFAARFTSVDRDDLRDGGAAHFVQCIQETREHAPDTKIEILVPDFRGRMDIALSILEQAPPDVFNHNLETVPRLYKQARPGADYAWSLKLISEFKQRFPDIPSKSGLMLGLGETNDEIVEVLKDLRTHQCDMLTLGQYLQPSRHHLGVERFVTPEEFAELGAHAEALGFSNVASGPMVRSSYHADKQASGESVA